MRRFLMCLPIPFVLLSRFFLVLFFHSHVVSNDATGDGTENRVVVHEMSGDRTDSGALEAALRFGGGDAAQCKARSHRGDHDMSHGWTLPTVF
jgi:hypothetical protein